MRALPVLTVAIAALLLVTGIAVLATNPSAEASVLTKFTSDQELRNFLQGHTSQSSADKNLGGYATAEAAAYSGTNTQVAGVEEGDMVKTDGSAIFIAKGNIVHIIGISPALENITDLMVGSSLGNNYVYITGLYLWESRLVVLYTVYEFVTLNPYPLKDGVAAMYYPYWSTQRTCVQVYDVSDPHDPVPVASGGVSGYLLTSRMIGPTLYIVTDQSVWTGENITLPEVSANGEKERIEATSISYDPSCPEVSFFVNLLAFDVASGAGRSLCTLAGPASVVYMSETALYLTMQHWDYSKDWTSINVRSVTTTQIYRIAVDGMDLALAAQGEVAGTLLNQFALDERSGRLRVATTSSPSVSSVHVLDLDLKEVGSLTDIAPGETIYSSRYLGDKLYLVTFRQIDPLFVIDLSTDSPSVLGQLKIPGVSTYLQMVNEGLLGIGFENGSVKVTLFNVSDPYAPFEAGTYIENGAYSYSAAQYDHHAVLYDARNGLLVIPMIYYVQKAEEGWAYYYLSSAAVVLRLGDGGITEVGRIEHANATVERSLYIGDMLYTISDTIVKANALLDLSPMGELVYSEQQPSYGWYSVEPMRV